jgi:hypothetical protein
MYGKVIPWLCNRVLDGILTNYFFLFHYFFLLLPNTNNIYSVFTFIEISTFDPRDICKKIKKYVNKRIRCNILVVE